MRIAVIGAGAREHALLWSLAQSPLVDRCYALPGNAGVEPLAERVPRPAPGDLSGVATWAAQTRIDLVVVGPEAPLVAGLADELAARGVPVFGPSAAAARIEGSKAFAKRVMTEAGVPTARAASFTDPAAALAALADWGPPWVVKADGLAAGKGVTVTEDPEAARSAVLGALVEGVHGAAGQRVLLEEHLAGPELSVLAVCDGERVLPLPPARDYKRVRDGDTGPNTGGMGAYSPAADARPALLEEVTRTILEPTVAALAARGTPYLGVLYAGLALTAGGPKVIEFNCRFGDPEAEVVLPRLDTDLAELLGAAGRRGLGEMRVAFGERACVGVVVAAGGYPGPIRAGLPIDGLQEAAEVPGALVFHGATERHPTGQLITAGGRVVCVTATGPTVATARDRAYEAAGRIRFEGAQFRRDIAAGLG